MKPTRRAFALGALSLSSAALAACSSSTRALPAPAGDAAQDGSQFWLAHNRELVAQLELLPTGECCANCRPTAVRTTRCTDLKVNSVSNLHLGRV